MLKLLSFITTLLFPVLVLAQVLVTLESDKDEYLNSNFGNYYDSSYEEVSSKAGTKRGRQGFCRRENYIYEECQPSFISPVLNRETSESFTAIANTLPAIEPFRPTFDPSVTKATAIQFKEIKAPTRLDLQRSMREIYKENAYCSCLSNRFKEELGNNFETALAAEREKTKKKILEGYGKKFVNQFTSHIENVTFFLNQNGQLFKRNEKEAVALQCYDFAEYESKVNQVCGNKISPEERRRRSALFLDALSPGASEGKDFATRMQELARSALEYEIPKELQEEGKGKLYLRSQYDKVRHGLSREDYPRMMDSIILNMMKNPDVRESLINNINFGIKSPAAVILERLNFEVAKIDFVEYYVDKSNPKYEAVLNAFPKLEWEQKLGRLEKGLGQLQNLHPGFATILQDKEAFLRLIKNIESNPNDKTPIMDRLETRPEILKASIQQQCAQMIDEFALAVCTPEDDLINLMSRGDLYEATRPEGEESENNHLSELLTCKENPTTPSFLSGIPAFLRDDYKGLPFSDYYLSQTTNSSPVLNHLKNSKDSELVHGMSKQALTLAKRLTHSIENGDTLSKHVDAEAVLSGEAHSMTGEEIMSQQEANRIIENQQKKGSGRKVSSSSWASNNAETNSNNPLTTSVARVEPSATKPSNKDGESKETLLNQLVPRFDFDNAPAIGTTEIALNAPTQVQRAIASATRESLVEDLADVNNREVVEGYAAQISEKELEELRRLKQETDLQIMKLKYEQEELKLKGLQEQLDRYKEKQVVESKKTVPSVKPLIESTRVEAKPAPVERKIARTQTQLAPVEQYNSYQPQYMNSAPVVNGPAANVKNSAPVAAAGGSIKGSTTAPTQGAATSRSSTGGIVISTSLKKGQELTTNEVSSQVITMIEKGSVDITQLAEIKDKGLVMRYQVIEEDRYVEKEMVVDYTGLSPEAKKLIEEKLGQTPTKELEKQVESQRAKLALLKMIMNEQTVH